MRKNSRFLMLIGLLIALSLACSTLVRTETPPPTLPAQVVTAPPATVPATTEAVETQTAPPDEAAETQAAPPVISAEEVYAPVFAKYPAIAASLPEQFAGGYTLPVDLGGVAGADLISITPEQRALLAQNGFMVAAPVPGRFREFYQVYETQRYERQPVFATTDAVFHVYHLIFDKMLRDLERERFIPILESLTGVMLETSYGQYQALAGTPLEEQARRNLAFYGVASQLLGLPDAIPAEAKDLVDAELALIASQSGPQISPLWDRPDLPADKKLIEDYSQYIPRGHYTLSEALQRYFRAMIWYGRLTFRLRDAFETQRALLLVQGLRTATAPDGTPAVRLWQNIYEPTVFIVGKADDLSYFEYGGLSDQIFGEGAGPQAFADTAKLDQFLEAAKQLPPPQVNSMWVWIWEDKQEATQGFRFMGQRFTLDQYVFGQLIWRNVGTLENPRGLPKALDFFAAMGSEEASGILDEMGETQYANYPERMQKVRNEIAGLGVDTWTQNLYWSWLYAFQPVIQPKDSRYPPFMTTQAWTRKDLNTALGSWTELKHDTILYAKQVMAEMGGGGDEPPHSYVEPNPEAYARLLSLAKMTYDGLEARGLITDTTRANLENLMDLLAFMQKISEQELAGQPISDDDYWRMMYFGGELEALTLASSDCESGDVMQCRDLSDQKAALVADVATGLAPDGSLAALEEGVGQPAEIYVVLPDEPLRIGVGAVFTYYEFSVPPDQRMTDEQWQAMVEGGTTPPAPAWTGLFMAP